MKNYRRGELAKATNTSIETIRFYENNKLIPIPKRDSNGYRLYPEETLIIIEIIKTAKCAGFTLSQIKDLFSNAKTTKDIIKALEEKNKEINEKIKDLEATKTTIYEFNIMLKEHGCIYIENFLDRNK